MYEINKKKIIYCAISTDWHLHLKEVAGYFMRAALQCLIQIEMCRSKYRGSKWYHWKGDPQGYLLNLFQYFSYA